jgi:hypothetical protein
MWLVFEVKAGSNFCRGTSLVAVWQWKKKEISYKLQISAVKIKIYCVELVLPVRARLLYSKAVGASRIAPMICKHLDHRRWRHRHLVFYARVFSVLVV